MLNIVLGDGETGAALVEAGANFIGGCCGTTPEFIRAVKGRLSR